MPCLQGAMHIWYHVYMKTVAKPITFEVELLMLGQSTIARLPQEESKKLSSRGQVAVVGTMNGSAFQTVLEPDGYWGHWMRVSKELQQVARARSGQTVTLTIEQTKDWPEPEIPHDFAKALQHSPQKVKEKWQQITPMARWEWIRWVSATASTDTRAIRIEKSISKLNGTHRRPCCFNLAACTDSELSKNGRLIELSQQS